MTQPATDLPSIKFFKDAVPYILDGRKTLEPRPRSLNWIKTVERAGRANLTYGPRMGKPTIFATALITDVELRGFDTATLADLGRIGHDWPTRTVDDFITVYSEWFAKETAKGYPVAWISFKVETT